LSSRRNISRICTFWKIRTPGSQCLEFNGLFGGRLAEIAAECGFLEKLLRVETETPFLQLVEDANPCQKEWRTRVPHRNHLRGMRTLA
jgi:hypothetical protein